MSHSESPFRRVFSRTSFSSLVVMISALVVSSVVTMIAWPANAARGGALSGGDSQFGLLAGASQSAQDQLNTLVSRANSRLTSGPVSTQALNSAWELGLQYGYRFSGTMYTVLLRPTYFFETSNGSGKDGGYNYGVTGYTIFPMLRITPLENDIMRFFIQAGIGYARANTKIEEGGATLNAVGDAFGMAVGLGAEFCLTPSQCLSLEGNYRYLMMQRNIASDASGTFASDSLSRAAQNREVELDGDDLKVKMGGLQFLAGYSIHF
jgi:opacity protein-like surface antigen